MTTTTTPRMTDEQSDRVDRIRTSDSPLPRRLERLAELAEKIAADHDRDATEFVEDFATREVVGCELPTAMPFPQVLEDLREFADYYDDFGAEGDQDFLDQISMGRGPDFTHQAYFALQRLYSRALLELVDEEDRVYEAVYRQMYETVRDPRPVLYQVMMEGEICWTSPKEYIEQETDMDWEMDNVDDIATVLIEAWLGADDVARKFAYFENVRIERSTPTYDRDFDAIMRDVGPADCTPRCDD